MDAKKIPSAFSKLLGELDLMAKALPADGGGDDKKIVDAAADAGVDTDKAKADATADANKGAADADKGADDADKSGKVDDAAGGDDMGKSFEVTLADGTKAQAVDGTEMIKALSDRFEATEGEMAKAMGVAVNLIKSLVATVAGQGAEIKKLGAQGVGRKTVLTINEKVATGDMKKADAATDGMPVEEFMVKAMSAQGDGKITGLDIARCEAAINRGIEIPADIVSKVLA